MRRTFRNRRTLIDLLLFLPMLAHAAVLPDGPGKAETVKLCGKCHSLDQAVSVRQGQTEWTETISKMVNLGAQGSEEDFNSVLPYLVKFYGPANGATGATAVVAGTPSTPLPAEIASRIEIPKETRLPIG